MIFFERGTDRPFQKNHPQIKQLTKLFT